ncbi:MAG: hypothetical protein JST00_25620 [Deltaproteobacteria bacterium]|nr:hypothetical protein [Deltaproteobacteria bacterium]
MTNRSFLLASSFTLLVACGAGDTVSGTAGAMQQTSVKPDCAPNDAACQSDGLDAPLAVGARLPLDVSVTARGVAAPKLVFEPARADVLDVTGAELFARAPGWSSVLVIGDGGLVIDFFTLSVVAPDRLEIYRLTDDGAPEASPLPARIQVTPGDDIEIAVKAFNGATRLLGDLDATWALDGAVGTLMDQGRRASRRLRVKAVGNATLEVKTSSSTKTLALEVLP